MPRALRYCVLVVLAVAFGASAAVADDVIVAMIPQKVVIHSFSAKLVSQAEIELPAGAHTLVIFNMSDVSSPNRTVEEASLQFDAGRGLLIQRHSWEVIPVSRTQAELDELQRLRDEYTAMEAQLAEITATQMNNEEELKTKARTIEVLLSHRGDEAVKHVESIVSLVNSLGASRSQIVMQQLEVQQQSRNVTKRLTELRANISRIGLEPRRELATRVVVSVEKPGIYTLRATRIVSNVAWRPLYDVSVDTSGEKAKVAYNAVVRQSSGRDWPDVAVELCTGAPSLDRRVPDLAPWRVHLHSANSHSRSESESLSRSASASQRGNRMQNAYFDNQNQQFGQPPQQKVREFADGDAETESVEPQWEQGPTADVVSDGQGTTDLFVIPGRHTLPNKQEIRVTIANIQVPLTVRRTAVPKLSSRVFMQGDVRNTSPFTLLRGTSVTFVDGNFISTGEIPRIGPNATARIDIGLDETMKVERHLVSDVHSASGGLLSERRLQRELTYVIKIKSQRREATELLVRDQLPLSNDDTLKVLLHEPVPASGSSELVDPATKADDGSAKDYLLDFAPAANVILNSEGRISWKRTVPADSTDSFKLRFSFDWPKDRHFFMGEL